METQLVSFLVWIVQIVSFFLVVCLAFRLVFGVGIDKDGNIEARKSHGVFLLKGIKAGIRGTKKVVDGATKVAGDLTGSLKSAPMTRPVVLKLWDNQDADPSKEKKAS